MSSFLCRNLIITFTHYHLTSVQTGLVNRTYEGNCLVRYIAMYPGRSFPDFLEEPAATSFRVDPEVKAAWSSETWVNWHYVSEDSFLCSHLGTAVTASNFQEPVM